MWWEKCLGYVRCRTPEYMSPELLHNGQDGTDQAYDPRSTDVWAAGVMLVVALCGAFPFDHTQHHHRSMEEAELDLWYELASSQTTREQVMNNMCWDSGQALREHVCMAHMHKHTDMVHKHTTKHGTHLQHRDIAHMHSTQFNCHYPCCESFSFAGEVGCILSP